MNLKVWVGITLVWYVSFTTSTTVVSPTTVDRYTVTNIQNGLSFARELGDLIVAKDFKNVIGKLAAGLSPFLGIVGPFVTFIMGFLRKSESPELRAIKRLFEEVDNRFDQVDLQFDEVKRLINWRTTQIQNSAIEQNINAVNSEFENIYKFSTGALNITTSTFVANYERIYQGGGTKLYNSIMNERLFGERDLFSSVIRYTEYDRRKSHAFMLGVLKLLMKAAPLELAYHQLKGNNRALHDYQNQWQTRFTNIRNKMESIDREIVRQYHTKSGIDIDNYLTRHPAREMGNYQFNNLLYNFLSRKYYWRDWLTVTYKPRSDFNKHTIGTCDDGYTKFRRHGRNVVVSSVDSSKRYIDIFDLILAVYSVSYKKGERIGRRYHYKRLDSNIAFETFPFQGCTPYVARGVIAYPDRNDVHLKAAANRYWQRYEREFNFIFVFG